MARKLRFESEGGLYHVINRGNHRNWVFESEGAKRSFEKTLNETCERSGWILHAWVIMGNHFHLAVETPQPNLSEGMRWLQSVFAARYNHFRKGTGRIFQGRFKSIVVENQYRMDRLSHYIHLNPVRAGICDVAGLRDYGFSSYAQLWNRKTRPSFLEVGSFLEAAGGLVDSLNPDYALETVKGGSALAIFSNIASIHGRFLRSKKIFNTRVLACETHHAPHAKQ